MKITWKWIAWICLVIDIVITFKFTWLRESSSLLYLKLVSLHLPEIWRYLLSSRCNVIPFQTIGYFIFDSKSLWISLVNLGGNLYLLMPLGFLLPIITGDNWMTEHRLWGGKLSHGWSVTFISFSFSLLIEIGQLLMEVGAFDVDDLILNTLGGWIGYRVLLIFYRTLSRYHGYAFWKEESVQA